MKQYSIFRKLFQHQETGLVLVVLCLACLLSLFGGSVQQPVFETTADGKRQRVFRTLPSGEKEPAFVTRNKFFNAQNLTQLAKDTSFIAIMAVGATFVIISGGIDLSVGAIYALTSVLGALFLNQIADNPSAGITIVSGIMVCLLIATICGCLNGGMIVWLGVHPFIITLGTMAVFRGIAFVSTKGQSIGGFPQAFRDVVRWDMGQGLSVIPLLVMLLVAIAGAIFLGYMVPGRYIYAIGGNETASLYSGIPVRKVKFSVYLLAGLTAGIAALLSLGYYGAASSGDGQGYELNVIAAAVVGGASLSGGKGSALGACLGALIIQMINSGIVILRIDQNYSQIIVGTVIIIAVSLDRINQWWQQKKP